MVGVWGRSSAGHAYACAVVVARRARFFLVAAFVPMVLTWPSSVLAQQSSAGEQEASPPAEVTGDSVAADTLFRQARQLMEEGRYEEACSKFADSQTLDPAVGTLLNLARCYEKLGKSASAWSTYNSAAAAARDAGQVKREEHARQKAASLEHQLYYVELAVPPGAIVPGLEIRLDERAVVESLWNTRMPVDPGRHVLKARAAGYGPHTIPFETQARETEVRVPRLELASDDISPNPSPEPDTEPSGPGLSAKEVSALVVGGVGVLALGASGLIGLAADNRYDDANCSSNNICDDQGLSDRESAHNTAAVATVVGGVGAAALVTGVVLWLLPGSRGDSSPNTLEVSAVAAPDRCQLGVQGRF